LTGHVSFLDPLIVEYVDGVTWRVHADFDFASQVLERIVVMQAGETTDFASVPKPLQNILGTTKAWGPDYGKPAALHDHAYRTLGYSFEEANDLFLEAMEAVGVNKVVMDLLYEAVKHCGRSSYDADQQLAKSGTDS
jgi:hypothetical protein